MYSYYDISCKLGLLLACLKDRQDLHVCTEYIEYFYILGVYKCLT